MSGAFQVLPPPGSLRITIVGQGGTGIGLSFPTVAGKRYQIEAADRPSPASWSPVSGRLLDWSPNPV